MKQKTFKDQLFIRTYLIVLVSLMCFAAYAGLKNSQGNFYICMTSSSYAYHKSKSCRGLNRCSSRVESVTYDEAVKKYGRKPCKICTQ